MSESASKKRPLAKGLRLAAIALLLAAAAVSAPFVYQKLSGDWRLSGRVKELRRQGEKLDNAELAPQIRLEPGHNALDLLWSLTNETAQFNAVADLAPPIGKRIAPGRLAGMRSFDGWPSVDGHTTNTWEDFIQEAGPMKPLLGQIQSALNKPGWSWGIDYLRDSAETAVKPAQLRLFQRIVKIPMWSALASARAGRMDEAAAAFKIALEALHRDEATGILISERVRDTMSFLLYNYTWAALQEPGWSEPQLAALQESWARQDFYHPSLRAIEIERNMVLAGLMHTKDDPALAAKSLGGLAMTRLDEDIPVWLDWTARRMAPFQPWLWRHFWAGEDIVRCVDWFQDGLAKGRLAAQKGAAAFTPEDAENAYMLGLPGTARTFVEFIELYRFPCSGSSSFTSARLAYVGVVTETRKQITIAAIAAQRFRLERGRWPDQLQQLVPRYLEAVPKDLIGGGELIGIASKEGGFLLYSKGKNQRDDGGDPTPSKPGDSGNIAEVSAQDILWPQPASQEATEAVLFKDIHRSKPAAPNAGTEAAPAPK